jgi:Tol biopolymer transport system component
MSKSLFAVCFLLAYKSFGQSGSEILLFDLQLQKENVTISNPKNITNHPGYDNQPSFHTDLPIVYYSSFNDDGRSDIKYYNYKTGATKSLTNTPEREYSPTLTLDKQFISCIIQRDSVTQDLGKYPLEGGEALTIINDMVVGYHVWTDNSHLALFILGKKNKPNTLHYLRLPTKTDTVIAENIGRSLHRVPGENAFTFVHKVTEGKWFIKKYNPRKSIISVIAATPPGREDLCWTPDGKIIISADTKIFWMDPKKDKTWKEVNVKSGADQLKGVTRLNVSPDGKVIAVVVAEK